MMTKPSDKKCKVKVMQRLCLRGPLTLGPLGLHQVGLLDSTSMQYVNQPKH